MSINKNDSKKINYKGDFKYFKERKYRSEEPSKLTDRIYLPDEDKIDSMALRVKFSDLKKKAQKIDKVIDDVSAALTIPIDKEKQPKISYAVSILDQSSNGEYLSYQLYKDIIDEQDAGQRNIDLDWLSENTTDDEFANSDILQARYADGAKQASKVPTIGIGDRSGTVEPEGLYANTLLNSVTNWNEHDFYTRQVVNWAQGWLYNTPDPAYIPWTFKYDMKRKIMEYDSMDQVLSTYTDLGNNLGGAVFGALKNPLSLPMDLWDSLNGKAENDNNFFNKIDEIFSMNYGADLICCFVSWAGGLDQRTLYAFRLMLQLAANGINLEFASILNSLISAVNGFIRNIIAGQLIAILDLIFQTVTDPIYKWLNSNDPRWRRLFLCTPIDEAINIYVLGGIEKIQELLEEKILEFMKKVENDNYFEEKKTEKTEKNKWINTLIEILDTIIAATGNATLCGYEMAAIRGGNSPVLKNFSDSYKSGPTWSYSYEEDENPNRFNSFIREKTTVTEEAVLSKETGEPTGRTRIVEDTVSDFYYGTASFDYEAEKIKIDQCLQRVSQEDVFSVQEWAEDIRAKNKDAQEDILDKATEELNV